MGKFHIPYKENVIAITVTVAISVARFDQTWLYRDPPGYFILILATGKILAITWLFGKEALKLIFT